MTTYIFRRLLLLIPTLLIVTLLTTIAIRLVPGDAIDLLISKMDFTGQESREELRANLERQLGLDAPIHIHYVRWMRDLILHGDLGKSLWMQVPVTQQVLGRIPVTFELGALALIIALSISFPIGIYSAIRQDTIRDLTGRTFAILGLAIPNFWIGTMVVVFPSIWWRWSPPIVNVSFFEDPTANLKMYLIPAAILGTHMAALTMRMTRTMMLEVLRQDYIRTAWSKGLGERVIVTRHALKNALIPVITIVGSQLPIMVGGSVIIEQIFNLPGMGRLMIEATFTRDYPVIIGVTFVLAVVVQLAVLLTDLSYAYLDPRIRYG